MKMWPRRTAVAMPSLCLLFIIVVPPTLAQFPELYNAIYGQDSVLRGVRNVMGGILAVDRVHGECMQKTLCSEFSDEIVEMSEAVDPVKRTRVLIPRVVQRRGRLRWIGDIIAGGIKRAADRMGINPYGFRRRQGGAGGATLAAQAVKLVMDGWNKIPLQHIVTVADFGMDLTNMMERKGNVYPYVKSAGLGYGYGHRKTDEFDGVCSQLAPNCGDWWSHLETVNEYEGPAINRKATEFRRTMERTGNGPNPDDPLVWNNMRVNDFTQPRVFLCKSGLFLEKLNEHMGGDGVTKERFGSDEFSETCDPGHLDRDVADAADTVEAASASNDALVSFDDIEIIDARDQETTQSPFFGEGGLTEGFDELPILVFEGLPAPGIDQTEEQLVESVLTLVNIPGAAVRTALRLPLRSRGRSIVLVEMDTISHRKEVIDHKDDLRSKTRSSLLQVGIRRARYKELWKFVRQLMVVKELEENEATEEETQDEQEEEEEDLSQIPPSLVLPPEPEIIEADVDQNEIIEADVDQNEVTEADVDQNEVIEADVDQNEVIDADRDSNPK